MDSGSSGFSETAGICIHLNELLRAFVFGCGAVFGALYLSPRKGSARSHRTCVQCPVSLEHPGAMLAASIPKMA